MEQIFGHFDSILLPVGRPRDRTGCASKGIKVQSCRTVGPPRLAAVLFPVPFEQLQSNIAVGTRPLKSYPSAHVVDKDRGVARRTTFYVRNKPS